jgi:hypothetical protein
MVNILIWPYGIVKAGRLKDRVKQEKDRAG